MSAPRRIEIERRVSPDVDELRASRRPCVLTGSLTSWPAMTRWTPEYFGRTYGATRVRTAVDLPNDGLPYTRLAENHVREMRIEDFVDLLDSTTRNNPCYLEMEAADFPAISEDFDFASIATNRAGFRHKIWLGSENTRSGLHFDGSDNLLAQVRGRKKAYLVAPDEPKLLYPYRWNVGHSPLDPIAPDLEAFPRFAEATVYEAVLEPGDVLFIPQHWWHFLHSLEPSISVNSWFSPEEMVQMHARILRQAGISYWFELAKQFTLYGVLKQNYKKPLFATEAPGKVLYRTAVGQLRYALRARVAQ